MALSSRLNVTTLGGSKELAAASESVYISSSGVRSADLSYSVPINPYSSSFRDLRTSPPNRRLMELPQPQHSSEGSKPPHDFLSLYGSSNSLNRAAEHRSSQGLSTTYLTTQDFLQPLERGGRSSTNNNSRGSEVSSAEASAATSTSSVEHVLPGGIGTYSISHISTYGQSNGKSEAGPPPPPSPMLHVNATEAKPEITARVTSAVNNYGVGGGAAFALWDERVRIPEGNRTTDPHAKSDATKEYGYWSAGRSKTDLSFLAKNTFGLNSVDVNQQPIPSSSKQRPQTGQGFVEMMKSMKSISEDDEDEDDEYVDRNRENRKEILSHKGEAPSKVDGKSNDQRANTPRSKHSATEQRRRSKINDRFQTLRDLVPHSDQKRDKASFLLEVIEYIQSLQEKVRKYEATEQSWNQERMKTMVWDLCKKNPVHGELPVDGCRTIGSTVLDSKQNSEVAERNKPRTSNATMHDEINTAATSVHPNSQNLMQTNKSTPLIPGCQQYREKENTGVFNKSVPLTLSMQQSMYSPFGRNLTPVHPKTQAASEIHSLPTVPGITSGCMAVNAYTFDREKDGNSTASVLLPRFQENTVNVVKTMSGLEAQWSERRSSQPSSIPQDSGQNGGIPLKDENIDTKSASKPDQHSNLSLNNRLSQSVSQSEAELASRQLQPESSSPDLHRANESRLSANEQEQLVVQGGVINVSSIYSQGLLDTLTQALRSSGLDLSQANISVQIDLGRQSGTFGATTNTKEHSHNQEEPSQNHQLQGQVRAADQTLESEQPHKRPKIERDL